MRRETCGKGVKVLAILLADIHLSLKAPIWRSAEPDWLAAQARPLVEVGVLQKKYRCPVICAGDVFDRNRKTSDGWNAPPELINYAIKYLPDGMFAIPGQHDLPNHQYDDIHRSAYWTLVKAGKIKNIRPDEIMIVNKHLVLYGFPPGYEIKPCTEKMDIEEDNTILVAVVHDYVWVGGCSYPNAPADRQLSRKLEQLKSYDVVVYGDNHKGFLAKNTPTEIFNCGTLMRRKSDEIDYEPQVGLLLANGLVVQHRLDISKDKYITKAEEQFNASLEMGDFFDELEKLGKTSLDFVEAMKEFLHVHGGKTSAEAKQIILDAMEK